ncbi:TetR/AcrR family transcriptional regulator [Pseudanabaena sp. FACHB-2040]|uniref:TetR/AcrR family transcriptional regulator n=1 Tax=Pseudanabaena sp. FACHB-2040 TaxID=2692859 RepID=UPI00168525E3|nr:TetR/AcrR family transcriptional regulator [Pseudanabaena sp. FACHB-2040]MBD2260926.1 TetR/AcrR family transcriptional regulator [Pseudanabaena sp. FACHB-2040]
MSNKRKTARQRLVQTALQLFAQQGVTTTTTRQIADVAGVNEVTLFRHFGSKHGLLLAVLEEAEVFVEMGDDLREQSSQTRGFIPALQAYAEGHLGALEQLPGFVRSLIGEAGHYPAENREAIGRGLAQIQQYTEDYLTCIIDREQIRARLSPAQLASLINVLLLGYAVLEFTTEFHRLWPSQEAFIADMMALFRLTEAVAEPEDLASNVSIPNFETAGQKEIQDLPASLVRAILQKARSRGPQVYALAYILFGAGISATEIASLRRAHSIADEQQHILQVSGSASRQVPLNQWIMGHRYGSHNKNPLTQWLRTRKDSQTALFVDGAGNPLSVAEIRQLWQEITAEVVTPAGHPPTIEQAQQTWRVEMLMRGLALEDLSILSGCSSERLQPYLRRAREKTALEQALRLDQRPGKLEA